MGVGQRWNSNLRSEMGHAVPRRFFWRHPVSIVICAINSRGQSASYRGYTISRRESPRSADRLGRSAAFPSCSIPRRRTRRVAVGENLRKQAPNTRSRPEMAERSTPFRVGKMFPWPSRSVSFTYGYSPSSPSGRQESACCSPGLKRMFGCLLSLGTARGNVRPSAPNRRKELLTVSLSLGVSARVWFFSPSLMLGPSPAPGGNRPSTFGVCNRLIQT
jgi:hypothetical protein